MTWTAERTDLTISLWTKGLSARLIAERFGDTTRNAVIGKVWRLGLRRLYPKISKKREPKRRRARFSMRAATKEQRAMARENFERITINTDDLEIPDCQRKTFQQLERGMCKYPVGNPSEPGFFFCGAPCHGSYCDGHAARCHQFKRV